MLYLVLSLLAGFLVTLLLTPLAMEFLLSSGIKGIDQQKEDRPVLPTSGGVAVLFGFLVCVSGFIGLRTFLGEPTVSNELILAAFSSVTIISLIGLVDDIHVKDNGEEVKGSTQISIGFRKWWVKPLFVVPAALPLMVVKAGHTSMIIPLLGRVEWGVLYPLLLVPVAVVTVSNATNMLAGQNGLESGMGAIALSALGLFSLLQGSVEGAVIALGMALPLLAFLRYNFYPARILPGDSLTYAVGAAFASAAVVANIERFAVLIFLPWIVEAFLKLRTTFQASSLGELQEDGSLEPKEEGIHSLTHAGMRLGLDERGIVVAAMAVETVLCIVAFMVFV